MAIHVHRWLFTSGLAVTVLLAGCSGDESTDGATGGLDAGVGGSSGSGASSSGGSSGSGPASTGGSSAGGARLTGGAPAGGGSSGSGGSGGSGGGNTLDASLSDAAASTGGAPGSGGTSAGDGAVSTGGAPGSDAAVSTGGAPGSDAAVSTGGAPGSDAAVSTGGAPGSGGAVSTGGAPGSGGAVSTGGAPGSGGSGSVTTISVSGRVVDLGTGTGFAPDAYAPVAGVKVCVENSSSICTTSAADGSYTLSGLPSNTVVYLTYEKSGYRPTLFATPASSTDIPVLPQIWLASTTYVNTQSISGNLALDSTKGAIYFGAVVPGTPQDSTYYMELYGQGVVYAAGYTAALSSPGALVTRYVGTNWILSSTATSSSAAGWGVMAATPGEYTFTATKSGLQCPPVKTKVVAGFTTVSVVAVCTP